LLPSHPDRSLDIKMSAIELTPLDEAALSPAVRKVASASAPPPLRMSVARGMAPLPPGDLVAALYQLAVTAEPGSDVAVAANKTAGELPDAVLSAALGASREARVLDFFARALRGRSKPLQVILLNAATDDDTVDYLAGAGGDAELELIGQNEQRLLRRPQIITSLYLNPRARMATASRAMELAVRNGIRLDGIPSFDEVRAAIESEERPSESDASATDSVIAAVLGLGGGAATAATGGAPLSEEQEAEIAAQADAAAEGAVSGQTQDDKAVQIGRLPIGAKIRLAMLGRADGVDVRGAAFARAVLVRDSNKVVALAAVRSPSVTEHEAELYAGNRGLSEEVIRYIASQRQFTRRYSTKLNLVNNPKCPLHTSMGFLQHLTPKDLRIVSRSKGIPSALAKAAQGLIQKREKH
jgi:hypothetical protein